MLGPLAQEGLATLILGGLLYFIPTVVAWRRAHHNRAAIGALNLLLGWTVVGWIGALIWALTRPAPTNG